MKTLWNQDEPIENIFYQIEECVKFAQHGNAPFTNTQVLNTTYYIMAQAKIFKDTCEEWKPLPATEKTWPNFKTSFFSKPRKTRKKRTSITQTVIKIITYLTIRKT